MENKIIERLKSGITSLTPTILEAKLQNLTMRNELVNRYEIAQYVVENEKRTFLTSQYNSGKVDII
jgi:hypothetical protein